MPGRGATPDHHTPELLRESSAPIDKFLVTTEHGGNVGVVTNLHMKDRIAETPQFLAPSSIQKLIDDRIREH
jgi:hypothetical protein